MKKKTFEILVVRRFTTATSWSCSRLGILTEYLDIYLMIHTRTCVTCAPRLHSQRVTCVTLLPHPQKLGVHNAFLGNRNYTPTMLYREFVKYTFLT